MIERLLPLLVRTVAALPRGPALALGCGLGRLLMVVLPARRRLTEENLSLALELSRSDPRLRRLLHANFCHYGMLLVEFLRLRRLVDGELDELVHFEGLEHLDAALSAKKGLLALTAHLGNYDLQAMAVALRGYPVTIISKPLKNKTVERLWMTERAASGLRICMHRGSLRVILKALKRNEVVGFVLDQHARVDAVRVEFFGRPASTLRSLAVIAERTKAPVVPIFTHRRDDGTHQISVRPPLEFTNVPGTA